MSDINPVAWVGPFDNGKTITYGTSDASIPDPASGLRQASAFKFSVGLRDFTLVAEKAVGGKDACIDVNNLCRNLDITVRELWPTGQFAITCKGGTQGARFTGRLMRHAAKFDVIIGDWSDQSHAPTTGTVLDIIPDDGQPVVVCVLNGTKPIVEVGSGPYVYRFPSPDMPGHDLCVYGFETLRRWGFWRGESNNP